jgi:hypothetical protein
VTQSVGATVVRNFQWIRWVVAGFIALVGLVFVLYGVANLSSQTWASATGTVGHCTATLSGGGNSSGRAGDQNCDVTWTADGISHTATIDFGAVAPQSGKTVDLRVNGSDARPADPLWFGIASTVGGLFLAGAAIFGIIRGRRRAT